MYKLELEMTDGYTRIVVSDDLSYLIQLGESHLWLGVYVSATLGVAARG